MAQPTQALELVAPKPPHPATVAQAKPTFGNAAVRPPHPATVAQAKPTFGNAAVRPPHPATVAQAKPTFGNVDARPPHPAAAQMKPAPHPATDPALEAEAELMGRWAAEGSKSSGAIQLARALVAPPSGNPRDRQLSLILGLIRNRGGFRDNLIIAREALRMFNQDASRAIAFLRGMYRQAGAGSLSESMIGLVYSESSSLGLRLPKPRQRQIHRLVRVRLTARFLPVTHAGNYESCLANYLVINKVLNTQDDRQRAKAIEEMRGKDQGFNRNKGYLYLPFLDEMTTAVRSLIPYARSCVAVFSIERGGALLSDHIENRMLFDVAHPPQFFKISKWREWATRQHELDRGTIAENVRAELRRYIGLYNGKSVKIGFCETMVSGDSANRVLEMLSPVAVEFSNVQFEVLLVRQTLNRRREIVENKAITIASDSEQINYSQFSPKGKLDPKVYNQFHIRLASVRWIPGEDVDYLTRDRENGGNFDKRLIVFDGTDEVTLCAIEIEHDGSARQALSQLIAEGSARRLMRAAVEQYERILDSIRRGRLTIAGLAAHLAQSPQNAQLGQQVLDKLGFRLKE
ncbi:hypothetical protein WMF11_50135 [Sorangium sp. So ce295]|uniref:hypothetical protein n=1 Tax=Sorangium sp. So ce295 TaxID=3133295 RepID=UPI003F616AD2